MNINTLKIIKKPWVGYMAIFILIGALAFFLGEKKNNKPIIIGYVAQLTGPNAEMGVQGRNGMQLAVETINASGGIAGRKIDFIVRDDLGIPEKAQLADSELIENGAVAIIGHATSEQALAGLKVTNAANVVMLSPTVSTPKLTDLDDYFFRVYPSFKDSSESLAKYIYQKMGITRMAIIYDVDNAAYTKIYSTTFVDKFQSLGGSLAGEASFSSVTNPNFSPLLSMLYEAKAEGLLIIASDIDTALIAQRARLMDWQVPLFTTTWAQTETLINNGGKAVEGLMLEHSYALTSQSENFIDFKSRYQARFGNIPSFSAAFSYEATLVLADALRKTRGEPDGLKQALLETRNFNGLVDTFSLNENGDVERPFYLSTIRDGQFIVVDKLIVNNSGGE